MKAVEPAPYETTTDLTDRAIGTRSRSRAVWILLTIGVVILGFGLIAAGLSMAGTEGASAILVPIVVDSTDDAAEAVTMVPETTPLADRDIILSDASAIGSAVVPSIVTVQVYADVGGAGVALLGSGSGVIYDDQGRIVTNAHVVDSGGSFEVVLADGRIYAATVVGVDGATDLAVLDIGADSIVSISLGSTDVLSVGEPAVAVGSPLGLDGGPSLTTGVLSAVDRGGADRLHDHALRHAPDRCPDHRRLQRWCPRRW